MAVSASRPSVGMSATLIHQADADGSRCIIRNPDATATVYLGGSSVTTSTGYALPPSGSVTIELAPGESVYGIVTVGATTIHVLETGK